MSLVAPISKDGFYYAGDSLYVEASGHNRHRRATLPELRALFHPTVAADTPKDPVGHWYEAQLLHYGLPPSKNKAVAKTRLLDALNKGNIVVPKHIQQLELELKKEWTKKERQAKAELKKKEKDEPMPREKKRKAEGGVASPLAPKSKPASSKPATNADDTSLPKPKRLKQAAKRGDASVGPKKKSTLSSTSRPKQTAGRLGAVGGIKEVAAPATERPKLMARRGGISAIGRGRAVMTRGGATGATASSAQRRKQTARRGPISAPPGRMPSFVAPKEDSDINDDQPDTYNDESDNCYDEMDIDEDSIIGSHLHDRDSQSPTTHGHLGLINGRYELYCPDLMEWSEYEGYKFSLILTLEGDRLWGAYDFGMFTGILSMARPFAASDQRIEFNWRGRENSEGEMSYGDHHKGWIKFLGHGEIEGMISVYGEAKFAGMRVSGAETRSERSAWSMKEEWDGYNSMEYERERRARWGRSRW